MGYSRPGDRHDGEQVVKSVEVTGIRREQRKFFSDGGCGDHQVTDAASWLSSDGDHRGGHAAVDPGRLDTERDRIELVLGTLKYIKAPGTFRVLVIGVLLTVRSYVVRTGGEFGKRYRADRHLLRQLGWINPAAKDQDVRVEEALAMGTTAHRGR
jgi:hypothetical protein